MKKIFLMSLMALVALTMTSCLHVKLDGKDWSMGNHKNDTPTQVSQVGTMVEMNPFDCLKVVGPFNVIYQNGESNTVRVDGTAEQLEKMTIYVEDSQLTFDVSTANLKANTFDHMRIFVTSPSVKEFAITGSGSVTTPDALSTADLNLHVTGSGDITIAELKSNDLNIKVTGSGDVTTGPIQAGNVKNTITGSGDITIAALTCNDLTNHVTGSGDITVSNINAGHVHSQISGSGDITLKGIAKTHEEKVAGSGDIDIKGLKSNP